MEKLGELLIRLSFAVVRCVMATSLIDFCKTLPKIVLIIPISLENIFLPERENSPRAEPCFASGLDSPTVENSQSYLGHTYTTRHNS